MIAVINNLQNRFGGSKNFPTFVVPKNVNDVESTRYISNRLDKAGFLSDNSASAVLRSLARKRWRLASFVINIPQIFGQKMPKNDKNLNTKTARGASCSTANARNSVASSLAKKAKSNLYQIAMDLVVSYRKGDGLVRYIGAYYTDIYQAANKDAAMGLAIQSANNKYGSLYDVDLRSVKCTQTYNL